MGREKRAVVQLLEETLVNIFARFQLRRVRSVCKEWKSIIDSDYFRELYESVNSTSVSWSIMNRRNQTLSLEIVGHHGCERWGLRNSIGSSITRYDPETTTELVRKTLVLSCADGLVLLYIETSEGAPEYHVGNPLLRQWVRIPLPPHLSPFDVVRLQENKLFSDTGLVTRMEKGIVVGYKVVWMLASSYLSKEITFMVYASETGLWTTREVRCLRPMFWSRLEYSVPLNGILHWIASNGTNLDANYVLSYDLYNNDNDNGGGGDDECRAMLFPGMELYARHQRFKRTITTSAGSVVYCNVFKATNGGGRIIRVWRLVNYCDDDPLAAWNLLWELNTTNSSSLVGFGTDYFPVVMHPLNSDIIYLWSRDKNGLVLLNLRTHRFSLHKEEDNDGQNQSTNGGCILSLSGCKEYMDSIYSMYFIAHHVGALHNLYFSQFVLPPWLNPLPKLVS
ncbi:PREDICTED: putative F-box protein At3g23950 [Camelina sativa]|uniref:F-box protein At3g23950 n=1 Tax=Camelina sativa TaxID=90675 RepID=A0ABM0VIQ5_CAMSA|nr:PREDICTED: putative F-box protein At3g23950 [Camelina sativa]